MSLNVSPRFSFQGWDVKKWAAGNKKEIKIVLGAVISLSAIFPSLAPYFVAGGVGTIIITAIEDIVDYWASEVDNSK